MGDRFSLIEPQPGEIVDKRYKVRREIARGGMAVVLEAEQIHLGRRVALKTIQRDMADAPMLGERLMREARALEMSRGPYVVDVIDAGLDGARPYLALEMLDGRPLDALLAPRGKLPLASAVAIAVELCQALDAVHRAGVVHRDVKPSNVFIAKQRGGGERTKLIDFGIARIVSTEDAPAKLTRAGDLIGTFDYMAPEQILAEHVDLRADLFAVGLVFYECVMGELPVPGGARALLVTLMSGKPLPSLSRAIGAPTPALDALMAKILAREAADRPQSASELAQELVRVTGTGTSPVQILEAPAPAPSSRPQRHHARAPYVAPIRVIDASGTVRDGQTADLSEGGLLALLGVPIELGTQVTLRVGLPVTGRIVTLAGVARWMREARHRHAIGFEFATPGADAQEEIRRFIELTTAPVPAPAHATIQAPR